jgi:hypothetical protein
MQEQLSPLGDPIIFVLGPVDSGRNRYQHCKEGRRLTDSYWPVGVAAKSVVLFEKPTGLRNKL